MAKKMTDEHKAALAKGRRQARAVRDYLEALERERRPGRKTDPDTLQRRIESLEQQIAAEDDPAKRVELIQKRLEQERRLEDLADEPDMERLESGFADAAKEYSARKGISYTAWREAGVSATLLKRAGIPRTDRPPTAA